MSLGGGEGSNSVVIMESCTIHNSRGSGIIVDSGAIVTMLNCKVCNNNGMGIEIRNGGRLTMNFCVVHANNGGVVSYCKGMAVNISNSVLTSARDSCVLICDGCEAYIEQCYMHGAKMAGVAVENKGSAVIKDCDIQGCLHGVLAQTGRTNVTIEKCKISKCKMFGIFIGRDCMGTVTMRGNEITNNSIKSISNDSGSKCKVYVNDILFPANGIVAAHPELEKSLKPSLGNSHLTVRTSKARVKAKIDKVVCAGCDVEQPRGKKYKTCSTCQSVLYCSRDCQVIMMKIHYKLLSYLFSCTLYATMALQLEKTLEGT